MAQVISVKKQNLNRLGYRDLQDWLKNENHVYIGRNMSNYVPGATQSKWHNPFKIKDFDTGLPSVVDPRAAVIEAYRDYILKDDILMSQILELKGKILGCWCKPLACHGDILVEILKGLEFESRDENFQPDHSNTENYGTIAAKMSFSTKSSGMGDTNLNPTKIPKIQPVEVEFPELNSETSKNSIAGRASNSSRTSQTRSAWKGTSFSHVPVQTYKKVQKRKSKEPNFPSLTK